VNCAVAPTENKAVKMSALAYESWEPVPGNYQQKYEHDNPIDYLRKIGVSSIFRFILTHPDMDHLGGVRDLFNTFKVENFWDTDNTKEFPPGAFDSRPRQGADWAFYKTLRDTSPKDDPRRLLFYSGYERDYFKDQGIKILSPTPELIQIGNGRKKWNDASYVFTYSTVNPSRKILFCGDSEDKTWKHLLDNWATQIADVDILIAPHHGRHSGRDYAFLKVVNPRLTLFGNALTDHHAHKPWHNRGLTILSNNQAGYIVLDVVDEGIKVYAKNETYARNLTERNGRGTEYSVPIDGWYLGTI
jgi:beta-lactamase superfamily II metal-dependent hydrolase